MTAPTQPNQGRAVANVSKSPAISALESTGNIDHIKRIFGEERGGLILSNIVAMVAQKPELGDCDPRSILSASIQAISMGLSIVPSMGHCAIVAYKDKERGKIATFLPMWRGLAQIAMRNGLQDFDVQPAIAGEVKKFDRARRIIEFDEEVLATKPEYVYNAGLKSKPKTIEEAMKRAEPFVGSWAFVTVNNVTKWHYLTFEDGLKRAQSSSPSFFVDGQTGKGSFGSNSFWVTRFVEMQCKSCFLALKQFLPSSEKLNDAIAADAVNSQTIDTATGEIIDGEVISKEEMATAKKSLWGDDDN